MKSLMAWSLAAAVAAGAAGVGLVKAEEPKAPRDEPAKQATQDGRVTDEQLHEMLKGLGYSPTVIKSGDGKTTFYTLDKTVANFRYIIYVSLQDGGKTIAFSCPLKIVGEPDKVPAEKLWALLGKNDEITPMAFSYDASAKQLYLNYRIANVDVTTSRMADELDAVKSVVSRTAPLWDTRTWPGGPQPAAQPSAAANPK